MPATTRSGSQLKSQSFSVSAQISSVISLLGLFFMVVITVDNSRLYCPLIITIWGPLFETTMPTPEKNSKQPSLGSHVCPWKVTEQTGRRCLNRDRGLCGRKQGQEIPERKRGPSTKRGVLFDRPKQQRFTQEENTHPRVDYVTGCGGRGQGWR